MQFPRTIGRDGSLGFLRRRTRRGLYHREQVSPPRVADTPIIYAVYRNFLDIRSSVGFLPCRFPPL